MIRRVLFVCTGNIFRSLAAEVALRRALAARDDIQVSSAGTDDYPHTVRIQIRDYLHAKGFDVTQHRRRTLTRALLDESDLVVAMSTEHRVFLRERYQLEVPLFTEACGGPAEPLHDIEAVIPDYLTNVHAVEAHVRQTIDRIIELAPRMASSIDALLQRWSTR